MRPEQKNIKVAFNPKEFVEASMEEYNAREVMDG